MHMAEQYGSLQLFLWPHYYHDISISININDDGSRICHGDTSFCLISVVMDLGFFAEIG